MYSTLSRYKSHILSFVFVVLGGWVSQLNGQIQVSRQVFSSLGSWAGNADFLVSYTVGQSIVSTQNDNQFTLTQGFEQPLRKGLIVQVSVMHPKCANSQDGAVFFRVFDGSGFYDLVFGSTNLSLAQDTFLVEGLSEGVYTVYFKDQVTDLERVLNVELQSEDGQDCGVFAYTGISVNADGLDDQWYIEKIEEYSENKVYIYDRWGNLVWQTVGYDNASNFWNGKDQSQNDLPTGTYFYLIELNTKESLKGWVQLTK